MQGQPAPDFTLMASNGKVITLAQLKPAFVVLVFYPANNTPTCNRQLDTFNVNLGRFLQLNTVVFGINTAKLEKQRAYCARRRLEFPILSDPGGGVAKRFHAYCGWWLPINRRTVVVVDPEGQVCFHKRGLPTIEEIEAAICQRQTMLASATA